MLLATAVKNGGSLTRIWVPKVTTPLNDHSAPFFGEAQFMGRDRGTVVHGWLFILHWFLRTPVTDRVAHTHTILVPVSLRHRARHICLGTLSIIDFLCP